jgi:hypothetical protein
MVTAKWAINALLALAAAFIVQTYALVAVVWAVKMVVERYRRLQAGREAAAIAAAV